MKPAPEVWLTRPESLAPELGKLGISYAGEEDYDRQILIRENVPAGAVRILPDVIVDTEEEIREVARELHSRHERTVIIVTSPPHTRRVKALWRRIAGDDQLAIIRASRGDPFDVDHWWRNTRDALSVTREAMGLTNTWAGLPVRPHPQ